MLLLEKRLWCKIATLGAPLDAWLPQDISARSLAGQAKSGEVCKKGGLYLKAQGGSQEMGKCFFFAKEQAFNGVVFGRWLLFSGK
nr:hypothetical protein [uncultured Desulfobulbus sp.]